jgi:hypothetical protein
VGVYSRQPASQTISRIYIYIYIHRQQHTLVLVQANPKP